MDISSITEGSEKETYIGQGSGVNKGTGIGALAAWSKSLVGKFLTWKNKPIYEELWNIIEDDLLKLVQEHEPALEQRRTWFSEPGSEPTSHTFTTADGKCEDRNEMCAAWHKGGACRRSRSGAPSPAEMRIACPRMCGFCVAA